MSSFLRLETAVFDRPIRCDNCDRTIPHTPWEDRWGFAHEVALYSTRKAPEYWCLECHEEEGE